MPIIWTPESEYGKELAKWNVRRPYQKFPQMLYKPRRRPDGVVSVLETEDRFFGGNPGSAEAFNATCQKIVNDEDELRKAHEEGWRNTPKEAMEWFEAKERAIADSAATRAWEDRNMSEKAQAEAAEAEAATPEHVAEVPEKRRRGRPRKVA